MPAIPYLNVDDLAEEDRKLLVDPLNLWRIMAYSPDLIRAISRLGRFIRQDTRIPQRVVEAGILTVGWETRAPYEWTHHVKLGLEAGLTSADFDAIKGLGETEESIQAIILAARELTLAQTASASTLERLRASFDDREVVELVFIVGLYNGIIRFLATFGIEPEEEYLEYLALHPLP